MADGEVKPGDSGAGKQHRSEGPSHGPGVGYTPARRQEGRHLIGMEIYSRSQTNGALISQLFSAARNAASIFSCFYQTNVFN